MVNFPARVRYWKDGHLKAASSNNAARPHIVVAISGASGAIYGIRALELLAQAGVCTHLIVSRSARTTITVETGRKVSDVERLAEIVHSNDDLGASCSSGSFQNLGVLVAPCSIKTMSEIATGVTAHLISRSADVALKERRRVVLMVRETPLHLGHIRAMAAVTEAGAVVYPPVPAFYNKPDSLDAMIDHTVGRALDLFGIDCGVVDRWTGTKARKTPQSASP